MKPALLVPVKDLRRAKIRLAPLLSQKERRELALLMLKGLLEACAPLAGEWRRVMVTNYPPAIAMARENGFEVLEEGRQSSESESVDWACAALEGQGAAGVARVPLDLPLVRTDDLAELLAQAGQGLDAVLVPSRDGTGTNALYRSPPTLFPSRFGAGSLALHEQLARERAVRYRVLELPSLALDIDDAEDVRTLMAGGAPCPARAFLEKVGAPARLKSLPGETAVKSDK